MRQSLAYSIDGDDFRPAAAGFPSEPESKAAQEFPVTSGRALSIQQLANPAVKYRGTVASIWTCGVPDIHLGGERGWNRRPRWAGKTLIEPVKKPALQQGNRK